MVLVWDLANGSLGSSGCGAWWSVWCKLCFSEQKFRFMFVWCGAVHGAVHLAVNLAVIELVG